MKNAITLVVSVAVIAGIIWYLESSKPLRLSGSAEDVQVAAPNAAAGATPQSAQSATDKETKKTAPRLSLAEKESRYDRAKELAGPTGFINSEPFKFSDIAGKKVILLDFWTYSCINCQRTTPYLNGWYEKYRDKGLEIVGVHTPEFEFEKDYNNVARAVKNAGIKYPVVLDSNRATWAAYRNQYWPRKYLIDIDGFIVYDHIGEGAYEETEKVIQKALAERAETLGLSETVITDDGMAKPADSVAVVPSKVRSPEVYFGAERNELLANGEVGRLGEQTFRIPETILPNKLYLGGEWDFSGEFAENQSSQAAIVFKYNAKNVYFVASSERGVKIKLTLDGKPLGDEAGEDAAADGTVFIKENRLYKLVQGEDYGEHILRIEAEGAGLQAFTFTFG